MAFFRLPPWEAGFAALASLALLSFGAVAHLQFAVDPTINGLLNQPLAWTLLGAVPLFAAIGWMAGDQRRDREIAIEAWEASTTEGMRDLAQREWVTRGILQSAFDAVLVVDDDLVVVDANPTATRVFGLEIDTLVGSPIADLLPDHKKLGTTVAITRRTAGGEVLGKEWQTYARHAAGHRFHVDINIVALRGPGLLFYAIREATTRVQAERRLVQEARSEVLQQGVAHRRQRGTQLLDIGHAIRGELDRVIHHVDVLTSEGKAPAELTEASYTLMAHLERLQALSVWERSDAAVSVGPVPIAATVAAVVAAVAALARHNGNRIDVRCDEELDDVHTDALRLTSALRALVANAVTHTHNGTITIDVAREPGRGTDWLTAQVQDTGEGLAPEVLDRIYSLFSGPTSDLSVGPGEGLGLRLAHRLARSLGGHISVSSEPGKGTEFLLRIPLDPESSQEPGPPQMIRLDSRG